MPMIFDPAPSPAQAVTIRASYAPAIPVAGDNVEITGFFSNQDDRTPPVDHNGYTLVDPTTVRLVAEDPAGAAATFTYGVDSGLVRTSIGRYVATVTVATDGLWTFRWEAAGSFQGAREIRRHVNASEI